MTNRPRHDRVVVRRIEAGAKTSGIVIPDAAQESPVEGEVLAMGPGGRNARDEVVALDIRPGDRAPVGKWSGSEVRVNREELLILTEADLMGIVEDAAVPAKHAA
jgi:chaperonin GroES